jgi:nucleolar GTP-binding protein
MLANDEWKFDNIPEIMNGMNVFDYIDPDILLKLRQLEKEEEERLENEAGEMEEEVRIPAVALPSSLALFDSAHRRVCF